MPEVLRRGLRLSYLDSAPSGDGRVVLLLHGFPDTAAMWAQHIGPLAAAGLRVIAPDTVGCGGSDVPPRVRDHRVGEVLSDIEAVLDAAGADRVDVVGHDWGAVLAWLLAAYRPHRVRSLVAMSVGHPTAYARAALPQKLRSWYILYFLLAGLAERGLRAGPGRLGLAGWGRAHPDIDEVRTRLAAPGRLTAALRLYRANIVFILLRTHPHVAAPCLGIWSTGDDYLTEAQMLASERFADGGWRYERLEGGHWIPLDQPERTVELILSHIAS